MRWLLVVCLLLPAAASAAKSYFTTAEVLKALFPASERVTFRRLRPDGPQRKALESRLGYALPKQEYVVFVALTADKVDGYAIIDDERGQHELITFAVKLSPDGIVLAQEVMVYREAYGEEIVDPRFRKQFAGKNARDAVRAGEDIDVVTGATISSRSMAIGVRRSIALIEELVLKPGAVR